MGLIACTALHCTALHCTALHCTALHCTALHCTALLPGIDGEDLHVTACVQRVKVQENRRREHPTTQSEREVSCHPRDTKRAVPVWRAQSRAHDVMNATHNTLPSCSTPMNRFPRRFPHQKLGCRYDADALHSGDVVRHIAHRSIVPLIYTWTTQRKGVAKIVRAREAERSESLDE